MSKIIGTLTLLFLLGIVITIVLGGFITTLSTVSLFIGLTSKIIFGITIAWMFFIVIVEEIISYKLRHSQKYIQSNR